MSIEIVQITDYDVNLSLLIEEYKDKEKFIGVLKAAADQSDDLEAAAFEVRDEFWLDTAEGVQLNVIGDIQKESRQGRNDTDYRAAIKVRITVNNGSGESETFYTALTQIYGATYARLQNIRSATLDIYVDIEISADDFQALERIAAAGVQLLVHWWDNTITPFMFDGPSPGKGWDSLKEVIYQVDAGAGVENYQVNPGTGVENYEVFNNSDEMYDQYETEGQWIFVNQS